MLVSAIAHSRETFSVLTSAVAVIADWGFSTSDLSSADIAWITAHGDDIVFSIDNTAPAVNDGHILHDGETFALVGNVNIRRFRALALTATTPVTMSLLNDRGIV